LDFSWGKFENLGIFIKEKFPGISQQPNFPFSDFIKFLKNCQQLKSQRESYETEN
jgi:hypothetical protein